MSDTALRTAVAEVPLPTVEGSPFTPLDVPLADATVAVVTTAALYPPDQDGYADRGDESFRILPRSSGGLHLGHMSQNYDRSGFLADRNVIYPLQRLEELADRGVIGAVSEVNLAFLGAARGNLDTIRTDTGPHAARLLHDAGADVVLLTPVCPLCTRTVCVLAHALERSGLSTVGLALVRRHAERLGPPRALAVDFPFGRPLGRPGDAEFQHRVLDAAFSLVEHPRGPVLQDFGEAVAGPDDAEALTCTLSPSPDSDLPPAVAEARGLRAAFDRGLKRTEGRSGLRAATAPDDVPKIVARLHEQLATMPAFTDAQAAEFARDALDVRAYYEIAGVALAAEQGGSLDGLTAWVFHETRAGELLCALDRELRRTAPDGEAWRSLVPRAYRLDEA